MKHDAGTLELSIPASTEHLARVRAKVHEFLITARVTRPVAHEIVVGIDEAVTNAIVHSCQNDSGYQVSVVVTLNEPAIQISVTNAGLRFDPTTFPTPDIACAMSEGFRPSLGIHLMRQVFDDMTYQCVQDGVNQLVLTKNIAPLTNARILPA